MSDISLDHLDEEQQMLMRPEIDRGAAARYFFRSQLLVHFLVTLFSFGFWLPFLLVWISGFGQWHSKKRAYELDYRLLPGRLLVKDGVFNKSRKTIPLDKVTDVGLYQGIVERWFGLWRIQIQTASSGAAAPEGTLVALADPKAFRRAVLDQRESWLDSGEASPSLPAAAGPRALSPTAERLALTDGRVEDKLGRIEKLLEKIADNTTGSGPP